MTYSREQADHAKTNFSYAGTPKHCKSNAVIDKKNNKTKKAEWATCSQMRLTSVS